jgi:hypothetical protein
MEAEGPDLAILTRRLSEAPPEVLEAVPPPTVAAALSDVLRDLGGEGLSAAGASALVPADASAAAHNRRAWLLLGAWLLREPSLRARRSDSDANGAHIFLSRDLSALAAILEAREALSDADRREEIARRALGALNLRPRGETVSQAQDRLKTLDSVERQRVILEMRDAQKRAREVREEMARKAAEEAAARYGRE